MKKLFIVLTVALLLLGGATLFQLDGRIKALQAAEVDVVPDYITPVQSSTIAPVNSGASSASTDDDVFSGECH